MIYNSKPKNGKPEIKKKKPAKRKQPTVQTLKKKLDIVFSKYIRLRDSRAFGYFQFRCISCGELKPYSQMDCGHFFSRTHNGTRYDEENCNGECRFCNRMKSDHLIGYRDNLINKLGYKEFLRLHLDKTITELEPKYYKIRELGEEKLDALKHRAYGMRKFTVSELDELIRYYQHLVKAFEAEK